MTSAEHPYCVATVIREVDPEQIEDVVVLHSFDEVVAHLRHTYDWFADVIADYRAAEDSSATDVPVGGFGVQLRNCWGGEVEVGVGRAVWFLFQHQPRPSRCVSDSPALGGSLVFYLNGWHYTELERDSLVSRSKCLSVLREWLETGVLSVEDA
jgi:hypothetical protein